MLKKKRELRVSVCLVLFCSFRLFSSDVAFIALLWRRLSGLGGLWQVVVLHFVLAGAKDDFPDPKHSPLVKRWRCCCCYCWPNGIKSAFWQSPLSSQQLNPRSGYSANLFPLNSLHILNLNPKREKKPSRLRSIKLFCFFSFQIGMNFIFIFCCFHKSSKPILYFMPITFMEISCWRFCKNYNPYHLRRPAHFSSFENLTPTTKDDGRPQ